MKIVNLFINIFLVIGFKRVSSHLLPEKTENGANITVNIGSFLNVVVTGKGVLINAHNDELVNVLSGVIGHNANTAGVNKCPGSTVKDNGGLCLFWELGPRLEIYEDNTYNNSDIQCATVSWRFLVGADVAKETPEDCYSMKDYYWFGGFEQPTQNWPMNNFSISSAPFVTSEGYMNLDYGDVIEGLFISSSGVGIHVDESTPLYLSINDAYSQQICLKGAIGANTPFFQRERPYLTYDICRSGDITSLWKGMTERYIPKPQMYPSAELIRYPIWSTWAAFKGNINQSTVHDFAESIQKHNLSISQLEIDDNWTPHYGDFVFDTKTFPDAKSLISNLTSKGIPVTVWVHWFFNTDTDAFRELSSLGYLIQEYNSGNPIIVPWWRGNNAGVLDVTNPDAVKWLLNKMENLKKTYNVTSFKFDAGETKWVNGKRYKVKENIATANFLTNRYAEVVSESDVQERRQELRVGFRSQAVSNMVRMYDRNSDWSHYLGIKTIIPCALVFGFMGYPYVLPDLIGGNAYTSGGIDATNLPEPELFIRWLQVSTFLPILQFSVAPWTYKNDTVIEITRKFITLHEKYADKIINLAKNAQQTGQPIVRPLWWIAPTDKNALENDSEFLLGNDLLVAPILDKGATSRDIYLPPGQWKDELRGISYSGGVWLKSYRANLDELPYFTKIN